MSETSVNSCLYRQVVSRGMLTQSGEKPHKCDICEGCFAQSYNLKQHMLTHTNEKLNECNIRFSHPSHLPRHLNTHTSTSVKQHKYGMSKKWYTDSGDAF